MDCQQSPEPSMLWKGDHEPQSGPQATEGPLLPPHKGATEEEKDHAHGA